MRFIHTADWHLGKLFSQRSMLDDQAYVLDELIQAVQDLHVDAVIIAGDIYDRGIPPADAVALFGHTLERIAGETGVEVLVIAGNHDNGIRLEFAARLLKITGVHVRGVLTRDVSPLILKFDDGEVAFSLLPYFTPSEVRTLFHIQKFINFDEAAQFVLKTARQNIPENMRSIAVAHAFLVGGNTSASERPLAIVGGSEQIHASLFAGYNYTALGHLHSPQRAGADTICYSGSLLPYSFDEAEKEKGFVVVDLYPDGSIEQEFHALKPRHNLRVVRGYFNDLLHKLDTLPEDDYVRVELLDDIRQINAREKLSVCYKNLMQIAYPNYIAQELDSTVNYARTDIKTDDIAAFERFYQDSTGKKLNEGQKTALQIVLAELAAERRG